MDNEIKKLLSSPAKNAGEDGCMAPPSSVGYGIYLISYLYI